MVPTVKIVQPARKMAVDPDEHNAKSRELHGVPQDVNARHSKE